MAAFKTLFLTLLVVYASYFTFYKCEKINSISVENGVEHVLHPLSDHHNAICDGVSKGEAFLAPYGTKLQKFLDDNVHSTEFFQKYQIHEKLVSGYHQAVTIAHPYTTKLFELVEVVEEKLYDQFLVLKAEILKLYQTHVAPKLA